VFRRRSAGAGEVDFHEQKCPDASAHCHRCGGDRHGGRMRAERDVAQSLRLVVGRRNWRGAPAPIGTVAFMLDGVQHAASRVAATYSGAILAVTATEAAQQTTLGFTLTGTAAATYRIGPLTTTNATLQVGDPARAWRAGSSVGSGSVTLTMLTPLLAVGTFTFSMEPVAGSGATGTRLVTDGVFNVTIG